MAASSQDGSCRATADAAVRSQLDAKEFGATLSSPASASNAWPRSTYQVRPGQLSGAAFSPGTDGQPSSTAASPNAESALDVLAGLVAGRGRSASPGLYTSKGSGMRSSLAGSHGVSPRTPRQSQGASDLSLRIAVSELQRQVEAERLALHRQFQQLEWRLQEQLQLADPAAKKRERWADMQGRVDGLLDEVTALGRRLDSLDDKCILKAQACEELARQKARELEQQLHTNDHKASLAASRSEEYLKRQSDKVRKLGDTQKEHTRRLDSMEEALGKPLALLQGLSQPGSGLEPRLLTLEQRLAGLEDDIRTVTDMAFSKATAHSITDSPGDLVGNAASCGSSAGDAVDPALLEEHASAIVQLRLRLEKQEERIAAATDGMAERLEKMIVAPPIESLRAELKEMCKQDRGLETRLEQLSIQVKLAAEANEEAASELKEQVESSSASSKEAIRSLEAKLAARPLAAQHSPEEEELIRLSERAASLEKRIEDIEQDWESSPKAQKHDIFNIGHDVRDSARLKEMIEKQARQLAELEETIKGIVADGIAPSSAVDMVPTCQCKSTPEHAIADGGCGKREATLNPNLESRLMETLGHFNQRELEATEVVKKVDDATMALLKHLEEFHEQASRPMDSAKKALPVNGLRALGHDDLVIVEEIKLLRSKYEDLVINAAPDRAMIVERITEILARVSESERATAALHRKVEEALASHQPSSKEDSNTHEE